MSRACWDVRLRFGWPFAQLQLLNTHSGAFYDPHALQERKVGAEATCHKKEGGLKRYRYRIITTTDREDETLRS